VDRRLLDRERAEIKGKVAKLSTEETVEKGASRVIACPNSEVLLPRRGTAGRERQKGGFGEKKGQRALKKDFSSTAATFLGENGRSFAQERVAEGGRRPRRKRLQKGVR